MYERGASIPELFERQVRERPNAVAVTFAGEQVTYAELDAAGDRIASKLRQLGVRLGDRVGIAAERSVGTVAAFLGVLKAGAVYVPLALDLPRARLAFMVADTDARVVLAEAGAAGSLPPLDARVVALDAALDAATDDELHGDPLPRPAAPDGAYVMYTSGSTGTPKGVEVTHRGIVRLARGADYIDLGPDETLLALAPLSFDASTFEIWGALLNGARLAIAPPTPFAPAEIAELVAAEGVSTLFLTAELFHRFVDDQAGALPSIRQLLSGGDVLSPSHVQRALDAMSPGSVLVNCYGPTENAVITTCHPMRPGERVETPVPIGRSIPHTSVHVLDGSRSPVPDGEPGELYTGGDGVARGYLGRAALTAERFPPDPFADDPDARMYRTGDRVRRRDDGTLEFLGRVDRQVKIRGHRIEPGEIEAVLDTHPLVRRAVAVPREDIPGHKRLVAYAALHRRDDGRDAAAELRRFAIERLPRYMVPSAFVEVEDFPVTPNGKIDRSALPEPAYPSRRDDDWRPTPTESSVAGAWAEVLRVEHVGPRDDFFELGGDSLLAIAALGRLRDLHEVELPLSAIFEHPTVTGLAASIDALAAAPVRPGLPPLQRSGAGDVAQVSFAQAQACFLSELDAESLAYQFQALIRLEGSLDPEALGRALTEIVRRHEILRTSFPRVGGEWVQRVHPPFAVALDVVDLRDEADPGAALERHARELFRHRMELDRLPLARWALARVADDRHVLVHVEHHVVHDGWSFALFLRELAALYTAFADGLRSPLPELEHQYRDFAAWQRQLGDSAVAVDQLAYWSRQLADPPAPPELPFDRPRPARQSFRGGVHRRAIPSALAGRLRALAGSEGVTLYMAALTAFLIQLRRYSGQDDLVVGSGLANRRLPGTEDLLGMFVNTAALRVDLSGDPSVGELLRRVKAVTLGAYEHQEIPFERVVNALAPAREAGANPYYRTLFSFHDSPLPELRLPGLSIVPEEGQGNGSAKADLNVVVIDRRIGRSRGDGSAGDLTVVWEYDSDLFDRDTAGRMLEHYVEALGAIAASADRPISELTLLPEVERRQLDELNPAPTPYERDEPIARVFEARVAERPDAVAILAEGTEWSYGELDRRANRLAHRLRALGVEPGARVGVCLERGPAAIMSLLAILKAGGVYVALDPSSPAARLRMLAQDASAGVVCTSRAHVGLLPAGSLPVVLDDIDLAGEPDTAPAGASGSGDVAYIAYTSGSTGRPKGVEVLQRGVVRLARSADYVQLGPEETLLALAPLAFDASTFEIWGALLNGGRLAIAPPGALAPTEIAEVVRRHGVTTLWLTAGLFHRFVEHHPEGFAGIRQLLAGGDVLSPPHVERALDALDDGAVLVNGYGPTEATTFTCCHPMRAGERIESPVPIGPPIANARVHVLDERLEPLPVGVPGELYIAGDGVARGYLGDPALTAERFLPDRFGDEAGARMYRSGDRVRRRADGVLEFLGRVDRQVKIRGFRVEPGEVEHALTEHPAVAEAVVVAVDHGPDDRRLTAYVVPRDGQDRDEGALRAFLADRLPAQLLPADWVWLDELPLNANGKVDHNALPRPDRRWRDARPGQVAEPETRLERKLVSIWQEVLGVRPIAVDDDFFDLGGHSLLAVELFARIEHATAAHLPLATIFEAPTVRQLAEVLAQEGWEAPWSSLVPLTTTGDRTPFFCVTAGDGNTVGYGALARRLGPSQPFYALQPRGLDGRRPFDRSVERMARRYLREVRGVQPKGPYLLGGRCLGGLVAFEMAQQLTRAGERVALIAVLDSLGPIRKPRQLANGLPYDEVMSLARRRAAIEGRDLGDPCSRAGTEALLELLSEPAVVGTGATVNRYLLEAYLARPDLQDAYPQLADGDAAGLVDWSWTTGHREMGLATQLLPPPTAAAGRLRPPPGDRGRTTARRVLRATSGALDVVTRGALPGAADRRAAQLQAVARDAAERYRADLYDGRLTLIRSAEFLDNGLLARWHEAAAEVEERTVDGTHRSMLREPDVASLADCLRACFDVAAESSDRVAR